MRWDDEHWIHQTRDRQKGRIPENAGNYLISGETVSFSRRTPLQEVRYIYNLYSLHLAHS